MNKKGFVTSALLYGILALFLVLILGTLAILGNRKLTSDSLKESALDDVQNLTTNESCFQTTEENGTLIITDYSDTCGKTVYVPETINGRLVTKIGANAFENQGLKNITIEDNIEQIDGNAFGGNDKILFIIKKESTDSIDPISGYPWGATNASVRWNS